MIMQRSSESLSERFFNLAAYSTAVAGSWREHDSKRAEAVHLPMMISMASLRPWTTVFREASDWDSERAVGVVSEDLDPRLHYVSQSVCSVCLSSAHFSVVKSSASIVNDGKLHIDARHCEVGM